MQKKNSLWLNVWQQGTVSNRLHARQSEIFTEFLLKGSDKLVKNLTDLRFCFFQQVYVFLRHWHTWHTCHHPHWIIISYHGVEGPKTTG